MPILGEPLPDMFNSSKLLVLDFSQIPINEPDELSIQHYFEESQERGINPRLPENRQAFNDRVLRLTGARYLIGRFVEDRIAMLAGSAIAQEGRTLHLGVDVFSAMLETVLAPCDGEIVRYGKEPGDHSYGHYAILKPDDNEIPAIFFGHLSAENPATGRVRKGWPFATLGDYPESENGGWSRHLHLQLIRELPEEGDTPPGYSTAQNLAKMINLSPDPMPYFGEWQLETVSGLPINK